MVQHPGLVCPRLRPLPSHSFRQTLRDLLVKLLTVSPRGTNSWWTIPFQSKKNLSTSPSHLSESDVLFLVVARIFPPTATTALLFQRRSRTPTFHQLLWHFSESFHQYSNDVIAPDWLRRGSVIVPLVSRRGTNFAATRCIFSFSVKIVWHELLQMPGSIACYYRLICIAWYVSLDMHRLICVTWYMSLDMYRLICVTWYISLDMYRLICVTYISLDMYRLICVTWYISLDMYRLICVTWYISLDMYRLICVTWYISLDMYRLICITWYVSLDMYRLTDLFA